MPHACRTIRCVGPLLGMACLLTLLITSAASAQQSDAPQTAAPQDDVQQGDAQPSDASSSVDDGPWKYNLRKPAEGWQQSGFDDGDWNEGAGGFGEPSTPGARVGTLWKTDQIWLRKTIQVDAVPQRPALLIHHDENAQVYLNGKKVADLTGFTTDYRVVPLDGQGQSALKTGSNLLAVHCRQTTGGQFIDVHLIDADNVPKLPPAERSTKPFQSALITRWGEEVTADNAWTEYPRPQLARQQWQNLNGHWDYAITSLDQQTQPSEWNGKILVPYPLESRLSGVQRLLDADEALWYRRALEVAPRGPNRVMLNFEAVDYRCQVWVNDVLVGSHTGGSDPFSIDVTDALKPDGNQLVVRVEDATEGPQLRGKQTVNPRGIWYTQVSGIWQTVWLEELPPRHIQDLKIATEVDSGSIIVRPLLAGAPAGGEQVQITVSDDGRQVAQIRGSAEQFRLQLQDPQLWSPSDPQLYELTIRLLGGDGRVVDEVASYTGIRSVGKTRDADGHLRFTLNGETIFHFGPLDQGWWPDGLLTPPSDEAMRYDIEVLKSAGFNMIRKHIKVEPRRYYYHCDVLGVMVWQDQVSGGVQPPWTRLNPDPVDAQWSDENHAQYMHELAEMVDSLENHPSIVVWVPFNEAWGQHRTMEVGRWMQRRDPSRLVNIASGGNFWPVGDVVDHHSYPHPDFPFDEARFGDFVKVVGEFGGHGLPIEGHLWDAGRRNWGYGGLPKNAQEYEQRYRESIRLLDDLRRRGIAAGVYTQTTDVEGEINGLMTYDRKQIKIPPQRLAEIHRTLFDEAAPEEAE